MLRIRNFPSSTEMLYTQEKCVISKNRGAFLFLHPRYGDYGMKANCIHKGAQQITASLASTGMPNTKQQICMAESADVWPTGTHIWYCSFFFIYCNGHYTGRLCPSGGGTFWSLIILTLSGLYHLEFLSKACGTKLYLLTLCCIKNSLIHMGWISTLKIHLCYLKGLQLYQLYFTPLFHILVLTLTLQKCKQWWIFRQ